jgi:hypothetical protein
LIRERYIITHFEHTINKTINDIHYNFEDNKELDNSYNKKTKLLYYLNYLCIFMMITNILLSGVMIYNYYYDGFRSVTGLFSCIILIIQKLYNNYSTLNLSLKEKYVLSTSLNKPCDYNTLDPIKFKTNEYIHKQNSINSYQVIYDENGNCRVETKNGISTFNMNFKKNKINKMQQHIKKNINKDINILKNNLTKNDTKEFNENRSYIHNIDSDEEYIDDEDDIFDNLRASAVSNRTHNIIYNHNRQRKSNSIRYHKRNSNISNKTVNSKKSNISDNSIKSNSTIKKTIVKETLV